MFQEPEPTTRKFGKRVICFGDEWSRRNSDKPLEQHSSTKIIKLIDNTASKVILNRQEFGIEEKQDYVEEQISRKSIDLHDNSVENHGNTSIEEINLIDFNESDINNEQNKDSNEKRMPNKVAMYFLNLENALQYIEIEVLS